MQMNLDRRGGRRPPANTATRRGRPHSAPTRPALLAIGALAVALFAATPAFAVRPDEMLKDPVLEARARVLSQGLRCLVCQNQSIDDSDATLAHNLRVLLRLSLIHI